MIRLSIPVRQALAKLTLPVLVVATFVLMLLGKADAVLAERARVALSDALAPLYGMLAAPLGALRGGVAEIGGFFDIYAENARLRAENARLLQWQSVALALDAENTALKANLHWLPDPPARFVTARVVADAGGVYARAALLLTAPGAPIARGQVVLDDRGLVGRVIERGARSARVLLITDLNSRVPVVLQSSRAHAILAGTNGPRPRLIYWPEGQMPAEGEAVVTSGEADVFPPGLPVGTAHRIGRNAVEVAPAARLDRLEIVRVLDYGSHGTTLGAQAAEARR